MLPAGAVRGGGSPAQVGSACGVSMCACVIDSVPAHAMQALMEFGAADGCALGLRKGARLTPQLALLQAGGQKKKHAISLCAYLRGDHKMSSCRLERPQK